MASTSRKSLRDRVLAMFGARRQLKLMCASFDDLSRENEVVDEGCLAGGMSTNRIAPSGTLPSTSMAVIKNDLVAEKVAIPDTVKLQKTNSLDSLHHWPCPFEKYYCQNSYLINPASPADAGKTGIRCQAKTNSAMILFPNLKSQGECSVNMSDFEEGNTFPEILDDSVNLLHKRSETTTPLTCAQCCMQEKSNENILTVETSKEVHAQRPSSWHVIETENIDAKNENKEGHDNKRKSVAHIKSIGSQVNSELQNEIINILGSGRIVHIKGNFREIIINTKDESSSRTTFADAATSTEIGYKTGHRKHCGNQAPVSIVGQNVYVNVGIKKDKEMQSNCVICGAISCRKDDACESSSQNILKSNCVICGANSCRKDDACMSSPIILKSHLNDQNGKKLNNDREQNRIAENNKQTTVVEFDTEKKNVSSMPSSSTALYSTVNEIELPASEENSKVVDEALTMWCEDSDRNYDERLVDVCENVAFKIETMVAGIQRVACAQVCEVGTKTQKEVTTALCEEGHEDADDAVPIELIIDSPSTTLEVEDAINQRVYCLYDTDDDEHTSSRDEQVLTQNTNHEEHHVHENIENICESYQQTCVTDDEDFNQHLELDEQTSKLEHGSAECLCSDTLEEYCKPKKQERDGSQDSQEAAGAQSAAANCLQDSIQGSDIVSKEVGVDRNAISVKLCDTQDSSSVVDDCGLVDVNELKQKITHETRKLNKLFSKYKSRAVKIQRMQDYLEQLKREKDEMIRLLNGIDKDEEALRNEAIEMRCTVSAVCDIPVAHIGKDTDARRLEPACFRRYNNIRTPSDASSVLVSVRNRIKALTELEVLIYRKELMLTHVLPGIQQDTPHILKTHKVPKSKKREHSTFNLASRSSVLIQIVSDTNNWPDVIAHTERPVTVSAGPTTSNDETASEVHTAGSEV